MSADPNDASASRPDTAYLATGFDSVRGLLNLFNTTWQAAWAAGPELVIDESMMLWTGEGSAWLIYLPRKPTPLGIMLKTVVDARAGILLNAEICEGKAVDATKKWQEELGAACAYTLRLSEPWHGSGRILIGDAWFGSYKTCYELLDHGLFSVLNVKVGTKRFPKKEMREAVPSRGDTHHMKVEVPGGHTIFASAHRDVQPMSLVHSCGTSLPGPTRKRVARKYDKSRGCVFRKVYHLE